MSFVTLADAIHLVKELKFFYGKQFAEQWNGVSDTDLALKFSEVLADVHITQFEHGLKKMQTSQYIPNIPEFKNWCLALKLPNQNWMSASEAWALCLSYNNLEAVQVSKQAMAAFKRIKHILNVEGQKPAYQAFKGFYTRIVERDVANNQPQAVYVEPPKLKAPDDHVQIGIAMTNEQREEMQKNLDQLFKKLHVRPKTSRKFQ